MVSLDAVSMFDNIPLNFTVECVEEKLHIHQNLTKVSKNEKLVAVRTVFKNTVFSFNKLYCKQKSGCPIGSPLSTIISNIVLGDLESRALSFFNFKLLFYKRYVDDVVAIIPSKKIEEFVDVFDRIDKSVQITD